MRNSEFQYQQVLVVGLGKSGVAAATLLHQLGARVSVSDQRLDRKIKNQRRTLPSQVRWVPQASALLQKKWPLVIVSPGVPATVWKKFQKQGARVWGELELASRVLMSLGRWPRRTIAVTGTNGKTTTTAWLGEMCRSAGWPTVVAGNIGQPLSSCVEKITENTTLVLEVSSYQLETVSAFRPTVGTVLNVTPDHLGRHGTMENYARAKFRMFQAQGPQDGAILNWRDSWCRHFQRLCPGKVEWFNSRRDATPTGPLQIYWSGRNEIYPSPRWVLGEHNRENAQAALLCARFVGVPRAALRRALSTFRGVEHRLEWVREWRGIHFINDSKATNVDSTSVALRAMNRPTRIILGGEDKGSPYTPLRPLLQKHARKIYLIGEATPKIEKDLRGFPMESCGTIQSALRSAVAQAVPGETILLSPACASFDQFENYEHRGRIFKEEVHAL